MLATAKLWNLIRYLHPRITGDSSNWDRALLNAIPKIEAAHADDELAVALDAMLATLDDPCTRIAFGLPGKPVTTKSIESDIMVLQAGNGDLSGTMGAGLMLRMGMPQTSHVVWDLRGSRMPFSLSTRADLRLVSQAGFGYAFREHSGYAPQEGVGSGRYYSSLQIVDPQPVLPKSQPQQWRQVYLIDKDSAVPMRAIVDQAIGRTAIISEDQPREVQAGITELVTVLGKVVAEIRVAEIRYPDGTTGFAPSRVVLNRGDEAVKAAISAMKAGQWNMPGERPKFQAGTASFRDAAYPDKVYPDRELRILAAMRLWGILRYFDPYLSMTSGKWDDALIEYLPRVADAKDAREYETALLELAARSGDPAVTVLSPTLGDLLGPATAPVEIRFIEGKPVVTREFKPSGFAVGDVIQKIGDRPVQARIDDLSRVFAAPYDSARQSLIGRFLLTTSTELDLKVTVLRKDGQSHEVTFKTARANQTSPPSPRSAQPIRLIDERTGYVDLERIEAADVDKVFEQFKNTAAIIFDLRGYPRSHAPQIAAHINNSGRTLAVELFRNIFGIGSGESYVSFRQSELRLPRMPNPDYKGKTVALIDDLTPSLTGESAMYLKAANSNTVLIGSTAYPYFPNAITTANLPGNSKLVFSGETPRWPGGKFVYPEGIKPDVPAIPTLAGLREKADEVLEAAMLYVKTH